jgi:hypothetical protein
LTLSTDIIGGGFHFFTWLNTQRTQVDTEQSSKPSDLSSDQVNDPAANLTDNEKTFFSLGRAPLIEDLEMMDQYLRHEPPRVEHLAYRNCRPRSRHETRLMLRSKIKEDPGLSGPSLAKALIKQQIGIFHAAESLFNFFLPSGFESRTLEKYWGSLYCLLFVSELSY